MSAGLITLHGTNVGLRANTTVTAVEAQSGHIEVSFDIDFLNPDFETDDEVSGVAGFRGNSILQYNTFDVVTIGYDSISDEYKLKLDELKAVMRMPYIYLEINDYYSDGLPFASTVAAPVAITKSETQTSSSWKTFNFKLSSVVPNQW